MVLAGDKTVQQLAVARPADLCPPKKRQRRQEVDAAATVTQYPPWPTKIADGDQTRYYGMVNMAAMIH
jgi:hypothetical protein